MLFFAFFGFGSQHREDGFPLGRSLADPLLNHLLKRSYLYAHYPTHPSVIVVHLVSERCHEPY